MANGLQNRSDRRRRRTRGRGAKHERRYDPEKMPADLRAAHDRNDEVLERIYIGRRVKNDTERLEKLFELYAKMTSRKEVA